MLRFGHPRQYDSTVEGFRRQERVVGSRYVEGSACEDSLSASQSVCRAPSFECFKSMPQLFIQRAHAINKVLAQVDDGICTQRLKDA